MESSADTCFRAEPVLPKQEAEETEDEEEKQERAMKRLKLFSACSEAVFTIARVAEEDIWQGRERWLKRALASGWWRGWAAARSLVETKKTEEKEEPRRKKEYTWKQGRRKTSNKDEGRRQKKEHEKKEGRRSNA